MRKRQWNRLRSTFCEIYCRYTIQFLVLLRYVLLWLNVIERITHPVHLLEIPCCKEYQTIWQVLWFGSNTRANWGRTVLKGTLQSENQLQNVPLSEAPLLWLLWCCERSTLHLHHQSRPLPVGLHHKKSANPYGCIACPACFKGMHLTNKAGLDPATLVEILGLGAMAAPLYKVRHARDTVPHVRPLRDGDLFAVEHPCTISLFLVVRI